MCVSVQYTASTATPDIKQRELSHIYIFELENAPVNELYMYVCVHTYRNTPRNIIYIEIIFDSHKNVPAKKKNGK